MSWSCMSLENEGVEVSALGLKGAGDEATRTEEWSRSGDRGPKTAAEAEGHGGGTEEENTCTSRASRYLRQGRLDYR